ncbi:MAG: AAA family ATPase [Desertifilum sp.]|nr:AAA family ATPase [Desertifilum sp.]
MRLKTVFVRFYKSFNFDYLLQIQNSDNGRHNPWDDIDGNFYPYVRITIEAEVTTVVGANESGKSHLLSAIKKGITGKNILHEDFCRYSHFFTVTKDELRFPDFGYEFYSLTENEKQQVRAVAGIQTEEASLERFFIFRTNQNSLTIYLPGETQGRKIEASSVDFLPRILDIKANIALPDSVPIERVIELSGQKISGRRTTLLEQWQREIVDQLLDDIFSKNLPITKARDEGIRHNANGDIVPMLPPENFCKTSVEFGEEIEKLKKTLTQDGMSKDESQRRNEEFKLAYQLICKIAEVDPDVLVDLVNNSFNVRKEGYTGAIIDRINKNLEESLNFPNWWVQDRDFRLVVSINNYHLRFAIRDRTGTTYSFSERSSGLKYFLSYYIQYKAHNPDGQTSEILLMDEPDAYLSSQAQQDLLRIFDAFASDQDGKKPVQVVYVTHSPFLIDKNHPERIRVVEKGVEDEGTRLVEDRDKNHYEPLRSAFGAFVGETTFIGNCNLMVEGLAEQILLAGAATYLRSQGASELETLNLNRVTIIPTEGATHIPYLTYLARGQGIELPAVIVLLDSDQDGKDAKEKLKEQNLIDQQFILQINEIATDLNLPECFEIEDLIPLPICIAAARKYAEKIFKAKDDQLKFISEKNLDKNKPNFQAIKECFDKIDGLYIEDVGFARNVIEIIDDPSNRKELQEDVNEFQRRFKFLFKKLNEKQRQGSEELKEQRISEKIGRLVKSFILTHHYKAERWEANELLSKIEDVLQNSKGKESKEVKLVIQELRQIYKLETDMSKDIDKYDEFKPKLKAIKYTPLLSIQKNNSDNDAEDQIASDEVSIDRNDAKPQSKVGDKRRGGGFQKPKP